MVLISDQGYVNLVLIGAVDLRSFSASTAPAK
jgi:hypothetical protein